jgi:hypothetical protein
MARKRAYGVYYIFKSMEQPRETRPRNRDRRRRQRARRFWRRAKHQPARSPKARQGRQRPALRRHAAGPVRDRGQQKTGDGRRCKPEDHFMSVSDERRKLSRQNEPLGIGAKPERDRYGGPDRRRVGNRRRRSRRLYARDFAVRRSWFETKRAFLEGRGSPPSGYEHILGGKRTLGATLASRCALEARQPEQPRSSCAGRFFCRLCEG